MTALENTDWSKYDFVDLGCSNGGSLRHCMMRFGVERGLGVDIDERKVAKTLEAGFDGVVADARELDIDRQVSFVTMLDFFEHLPGLDYVHDILAAAARSARDFIYIKHPSFEGQERVEADGLRQYWWHWHGHTAHIRIADYCTILDELGLSTYLVRYIERVGSSEHPSIVPTSTPQDCSAEQAAAIVIAPPVEFTPPLWRRQDIFIALRPFSPKEWESVTRPTANDFKLMRDSGQFRNGENPPVHLRPVRKARAIPPAANIR